MNKLKLFTFLALFLSAVAVSPEWLPVWEDEFRDTVLSPQKWTPEIFCEGHQCYTDSNLKINSDKLHLHPKQQTLTGTISNCTSPATNQCIGSQESKFTSSRVRTLCFSTGNRRYGRWEIQVKFPSTPGLVGNIMLMNSDQSWGEGLVSGAIGIVEYNTSNHHLKSYMIHSKPPVKTQVIAIQRDLTNFHNFTVEWTIDEIKWFYDGTLMHIENLDKSFYIGTNFSQNPYIRNRSPFDRKFHVVITLDVAQDAILSNMDADSMVVESVRILRPEPLQIFPRTPLTFPEGYIVPTVNEHQWQLVWNDEFDGSELNRSKWNNDVDCWGGGNNELQCYTSRQENVRVNEGKLIIEARQELYTGTIEDCTNNLDNSCGTTRNFTSGRVKTNKDPTGAWKYGKFEIRAKMPNGKNLWPALWLLGSENKYGTWAASGEIDIMEARGQDTHEFEGSLHYGGVWPYNRFLQSDLIELPFDLTEDFHNYGIEWEQDEIRWYLDGIQFFKQDLNRSFYCGCGKNPYNGNGQPFNEKFSLVMNVGISGAYFSDPMYQPTSVTVEEGRQWNSPTLEVDYVRVYQRSNTGKSLN